MGMVARLAAASALQTMLLCSPVFAATFLPVTPPADAVDSAVIALNDQGDVGGSYSTAAGAELGYVGSVDGNYESFDVNSLPTQARGLNNQGLLIGIYFPEDSVGEFARKKDGTIDIIAKSGTPLVGIAQGVNPVGDFVGDYFRDPGSMPLRGGYKGKNTAWASDVDLPFPAVRVAPRAINAQGDIAGWFIAEPGGAAQGFLMKNGVTTVLNYPGATMTFIQGMNNKGEMSGAWNDSNGDSHGFALDKDLVTWTSLDAPGAAQTQAWQINNLGQVAVSGGATNLNFIYCPKKAGVCNGGPKETPAAMRTAKGVKKSEPETGRRGPDPDADHGNLKHRN